MSTFEPARCPKCGVVHEGQHIGTILIRGKISIYHSKVPNEPIAGYNLCPKCYYIQDMWLIPGAKDGNGNRAKSVAEKHGITIHDVRACFKQMPCDFYAVSELKAPKVRGAQAKVVNVEYQPDAYIEPKREAIQEIF